MSADSEMYLSFKNVFVDGINQNYNEIIFNTYDLTQNWKEFFMK